MSDPYRGFHELPRDVFESLRAVAECVIAQAIEEATPAPPAPPPPPPTPPRARRVGFGPADWGRVLTAALRDRGFTEVLTNVHAIADTVSFHALHRCGAWCVVPIDGWALMDGNKHRTLDDLMISFGCFCVTEPAAPEDWWHMHAPMCGIARLGCVPGCPVAGYQRTGKWRP